MKNFTHIILTGLMIQFLPLSAENAQEDEAFSLIALSELTAERVEEAPAVATLDEELSMLDEEFEEFKEELQAIEDAFKGKEQKLMVVEEAPPQIQEEIVVSEEPEALAEPILVVQENVEEALPVVLSEEVTTPLAEVAVAAKELVKEPPAILNVESTSAVGEIAPLNQPPVSVDLKAAFSGSPIIYSILLAMSVFAVCVWLYAIFSMRASTRLPNSLLREVRNKLSSNQIEETLSLCTVRDNLFCRMVTSGIHSRRHGLPVMIEAMKAEGKRSTTSFWQRIGLLNDIAIIAPMLGLLGTVLGMFYAFYNVNRSIESISILFDGLGISVGTTVAGLVVAIMALILYSTAKYRLVRALAHVENEAQSMAVLIDDRTSILKG